MNGSAVIDGCYRYRLTRDVNPCGEGDVVFVMLNPSTADAKRDDPTIRRCVGFARRLGFDRLVVVNLYALRATDPREILAARDPVGPQNDDYIVQEALEAQMVVAAWGVPMNNTVAQRAAHVVDMLRRSVPLYALGLSAWGHPRHPLYLPNTCGPVIYRKTVVPRA